MKKILLSLFISVTAIGFAQDLTSNLKVCMPFNGNANDVSGSGNNGVNNGATLTTDRFGNANKAYQFNGTSDFISVANFAGIAPTNELTISMWAKCDLTTSNCLFMLSPDNPSDRCVGCAQYANGGNTMMLWDYGNISSGGRTSATGIASDLSNWHHYVYIISQSGNIKQMYLDGVIKSNAAYGLSCSNKSLPFYIGAANDGGAGGSIRFHGKIDDICIYNRALTSSEVSLLHSGTGVCFNVGVEELTSLSHGIFYPTVSDNGLFSYSGDIAKLNGVEIYTVDGKLLELVSKTEMSDANGELHLKDYSNGIYFIKLIKTEGVFTQKIVISK
jgi:hypothetical protein